MRARRQAQRSRIENANAPLKGALKPAQIDMPKSVAGRAPDGHRILLEEDLAPRLNPPCSASETAIANLAGMNESRTVAIGAMLGCVVGGKHFHTGGVVFDEQTLIGESAGLAVGASSSLYDSCLCAARSGTLPTSRRKN